MSRQSQLNPAIILGLVIASLALGCATSAGPSTSDLDVQIQQIEDSEFVVQSRNAVSTAYFLVVHNRSDAAVTLRQLDMQTSPRSPYVLRKEPVALDRIVEPGDEASVPFSMWAVPRDQGGSGPTEAWVNGTLTYERSGQRLEKAFTTRVTKTTE